VRSSRLPSDGDHPGQRANRVALRSAQPNTSSHVWKSATTCGANPTQCSRGLPHIPSPPDKTAEIMAAGDNAFATGGPASGMLVRDGLRRITEHVRTVVFPALEPFL
jgi:hypothetical protein